MFNLNEALSHVFGEPTEVAEGITLYTSTPEELAADVALLSPEEQAELAKLPTAKDEPELTAADLAAFTGSDEFYRHGMVRSVVFTSGVKYLADRAGAYWLLDEVALANRFAPEVLAEEFQVWDLVLDVDGESGAWLRCGDGGKDGNESKVVFSKRIPYTDFPLPSVRLYCEFNGDGYTVMLPRER